MLKVINLSSTNNTERRSNSSSDGMHLFPGLCFGLGFGSHYPTTLFLPDLIKFIIEISLQEEVESVRNGVKAHSLKIKIYA